MSPAAFVWREDTPQGHIGVATVGRATSVFVNDGDSPRCLGPALAHSEDPSHCPRCWELLEEIRKRSEERLLRRPVF